MAPSTTSSHQVLPPPPAMAIPVPSISAIPAQCPAVPVAQPTPCATYACGDLAASAGRVGVQVVTPTSQAPRVEEPAATVVQAASQAEGVTAANALAFAHDSDGCWLVQRALDDAPSDDARAALMDGFRGHVWEAMRCPHANHVLQKYLVAVKPSACQFIVDEVLQLGAAGVVRAAKHKYACRVLQRMLEHLRPHQTEAVAEIILADLVRFATHRYANYVVQHLLEFGTEDHQCRTIAQLEAHALALSRDSDSCMVLDKALQVGEPKQQASLAQALLMSGGAVPSMAHTRRGHVAVLSLLEFADGPELDEARHQLAQREASLRASRYGRTVLQRLRELQQEGEHGIAGVVGGA